MIPHLYWIISSYFNIHTNISFSNHKYWFQLHLIPISSHVDSQINRTQSHSICNHSSSGALITRFSHSGLTFYSWSMRCYQSPHNSSPHISVITIWDDATVGTDFSGGVDQIYNLTLSPLWIYLLAPGRCGCNIKLVIFKLIIKEICRKFHVKLLWGECHRTSSMNSQHWLYGLVPSGAGSVDPDLWGN